MFLGDKQIVESLGIRLGVLTWFDLGILILIDADQHDVRLPRLLLGLNGRCDQAAENEQRHKTQALHHTRGPFRHNPAR